ncbi:MAG: aldo/keto reductase [Novosphingobium sp.]
MRKRELGSGRLEVSALGFGAMALSGVYESVQPDEAVATLRRALDLGISMVDTADFYGKGARTGTSEWGHNEQLVGNAIAGLRNQIVLATKGGYTFGPDGAPKPNGRPGYLDHACERSLRRLGVDVIDLYYLHRVDPLVPVEDSIGALAELVHQGKVRHIGLSEATADEIRRGHAVHPLTAIQSEYSLLNREPEKEVLPVCRELGIGFVPFAALGRGLLSGAIKSVTDLAPEDWRRVAAPRFRDENLTENLRLIGRLAEIAHRLSVTVPQLAVAWILHQGADLVPLVGATRPEFVENNVGAVTLKLASRELAEIAEIFPIGAAKGARYPEEYMRSIK